MKTINTPIVEDVSMEDAVNNFVKKEYSAFEPYDNETFTDMIVSKNDFKSGWQQREQQLIPIIKELGEALKDINHLWKTETSISSLVEKMEDLEPKIQTTLDKYKNYL